MQRLRGGGRATVLHNLQRSAGNAATARLLGATARRSPARTAGPGETVPRTASSVPTVQRCGAKGSCGCGCSQEAGEEAAVQRTEEQRPAALTVQRDPQTPRTPPTAPGGQLGPSVPRPAGLPLDGAYKLQPIDGLPPELVAAMPEGQMITVEVETPVGPGGPGGFGAGPGAGMLATPSSMPFFDSPTDVTEPLAAGAASGLHHGNAALRAFGFAAGGENAIGLVAIPRVNLNPFGGRFVMPDPAAPLDTWGHTAVVVRQNGRIVAVRGFNPDAAFPGGLVRLLRQSGAVEAGRGSLPAVVSADQYLFTHPRAMSVEWAVDADMAQKAFTELSPTGPAGQLGHPTDYTARPAQFQGACTTSNCGLWATEQVEGRLGGPVGRAGQGPITAVGEGGATVPRTASQGRLMGMLTEAERAQAAGHPSTLGPMPHAQGGPVVSAMPTKYRLLKVGGRVMLVVGIAADAHEFFSASSAEKPRVAVGIAGGVGGGFLGGAAAGLVCGPGVLVCSILFGAAGALGGRALAQALFDAFPDPQSSPCIPAYRNLPPAGSGECPNCHRIRREQECRDEFAPRFPGREMFGPGPLGSGASDFGPGPFDRQPGQWGRPELDAFYGAASQRGAPQPQRLSPQDEAAIRAWLSQD